MLSEALRRGTAPASRLALQRLLEGPNAWPNVIIAVCIQATIKELKDGVHTKSGVAPGRQRLIYQGKELQDHVTLADAKLSDGCVIHIVERMLARTSEGVSSLIG